MKQPQYGLTRRDKKGKLIPSLIVAAGSIWLLTVFAWFAHAVGELYRYHPGLGKPLMLGQFATYWPWTVFSWPSEVWNHSAVDRLLQNYMSIFAALPIAIFILYMACNRKQGEIADLHGSAHFASRREIEDMGYFENEGGVYIGGWWDKKAKIQRYLRENGPIHILTFAPTRSGKGVGLILPTLVSWEGSSVVLDIKGENFAYTSGYLTEQGHRVLRFDPADYTRRSTRYNPLAEIRLNTGHCISDVQRIASMVLDPDGKGLEDHWTKAAFSFFGAVILHCLIMTRYEEERIASLYDVVMTMRDPKNVDGDQKTLFRDIAETDHAALLLDMFGDMDEKLAESMHVYCASAASGMVKTPDKELGSIISTAIVNLSLYTDPVVAWNIAESEFTINDLMHSDNPVNLYLVISPADIDRIRPLVRIFISQLLGRLTEKMDFKDGSTKASYKHRLLLMMDEFTSLGKLSIVERAIAYMAGYGIKGYFIVQDTKQLNQTYGQDNALMANCHVRIAYAPNLIETAEYLSKMTGTTTIVQRKKSLSAGKGGSGSSTSIQETARPLMTPDECMRLPGMRKATSPHWKRFSKVEPGEMLIFTAGNSPIRGLQILHFVDPILRARTMYPPKVDGKDYLVEKKTKPVARVEADGGQQAEQESGTAAYMSYFEGDVPAELVGELAA